MWISYNRRQWLTEYISHQAIRRTQYLVEDELLLHHTGPLQLLLDESTMRRGRVGHIGVEVKLTVGTLVDG